MHILPSYYWCVSWTVREVETSYVSIFVITLLSNEAQLQRVSNFYWGRSGYQYSSFGRKLSEYSTPPAPPPHTRSQCLVWFSDIKRAVPYLESCKVKCNAENCKILNRLQEWVTGWKIIDQTKFKELQKPSLINVGYFSTTSSKIQDYLPGLECNPLGSSGKMTPGYLR